MNAYALIITEEHSGKVGTDAEFVYVCGKLQECKEAQPIRFRDGVHPQLPLSRRYLSEAGDDDKTPSINLLHSGQWHLGSSMTWITN